MNKENLNDILNLAARLSPKALVVIVRDGGADLVNTRLPFTLVRAMLKFTPGLNAILAEHAPGLDESEVKELLRSIDVDAILAELAAGGVSLPYTIADIQDSAGRYIFVRLE